VVRPCPRCFCAAGRAGAGGGARWTRRVQLVREEGRDVSS